MPCFLTITLLFIFKIALVSNDYSTLFKQKAIFMKAFNLYSDRITKRQFDALIAGHEQVAVIEVKFDKRNNVKTFIRRLKNKVGNKNMQYILTVESHSESNHFFRPNADLASVQRVAYYIHNPNAETRSTNYAETETKATHSVQPTFDIRNYDAQNPFVKALFSQMDKIL